MRPARTGPFASTAARSPTSWATREYRDEGETSTKNRYFAAPKSQHERIATYYLSSGTGPDGDWTLCDGYGLRQVVTHLRMWLDLADDLREKKDVARQLYDVVLDPRFGAEQRSRLGGVDATIADCRIALEACLARNDLDVAETIVRTLAADLDPEVRALSREFTCRVQAVDTGRFERLTKSMLA